MVHNSLVLVKYNINNFIAFSNEVSRKSILNAGSALTIKLEKYLSKMMSYPKIPAHYFN